VEGCEKQSKSYRDTKFTHQVIVVAVVFIFVLLLGWFLWRAAHIMLLLFLGILMAVFLRGLASLLHRATRLPLKWSLIVVIFVLFGFFTLSGYVLVPRISSQIAILSKELPRAIGQIRSNIEKNPWGKKLIEHIPGTEQLMKSEKQIVIQTLGIFATTIGITVSAAIVLFSGFYLAFAPEPYLRGIVGIIPPGRRKRAETVLRALGTILARWLIGRFCAMMFVSILVAGGLWIMNIHLALTLSIIAGLMDFVPNIGPLVAIIPVVLLTLAQSKAKVLYVVLLYLAVLSIEGYLFTPLVQQREVSLPPVLVLMSQIVMGLFFGALGVILATPLVACVVVLVRMLYIEDMLGDAPAS